MTWIKFTLWLLSVYSIYYSANILWDLFINRTRGDVGEDHELTFAEPVRSVGPDNELTSDNIRSPVVASGGVGLKQLFFLAQEEAIEYTSQVSF
jgi:hypothetical protein